MKNLKEHLVERGISIIKMARELRAQGKIKAGYHAVQKVVGRKPYRTRRGEIRFRETPHIREAVAAYLGLPYEKVWGPRSPH